MKYLAVFGSIIFLILLSVFGVIQCYTRPFPSTAGVENLRVRVDAVFRDAWRHRDLGAVLLYRTVFGNGDKNTFFSPRVRTVYDPSGDKQGYTAFGMVTAWDVGEKLLTLSSYAGGTLYVRFDPDVYGQKAILPALDAYGSVDILKPIGIITSLAIPNANTLFCVRDVVSITADTWQELFSTTPVHPAIPKEVVLSFRLCQNTP